MYKLGPLHQGVLERGCKTGSFSYLLLPSRVGAFTAIIGKHYANFDTSEFPFSYISEEGGKSTLVPGMNFFTVGTLRDMAKWPARDRRKAKRKLDCLIFDALSPYTARKMIAGQNIITELYDKSIKESESGDHKPEWVTYKGIHIKRLLLKTCRRYYGLILDKYFGDLILKRFEQVKPAKLSDLFVYAQGGEKGDGEWIDVCGLLCRKTRMDKLVAEISSGKIASAEDLQSAIETIQSQYADDEWNWFLSWYHRSSHDEKELAAQGSKEIQHLLDAWKTASSKLVSMVLNDAEKEFDQTTRLGFGIDGNRDEDFEAVRGTFEGNSFVKQLKAQQEIIERNYANLLKLNA
jgi:hypothetical protein